MLLFSLLSRRSRKGGGTLNTLIGASTKAKTVHKSFLSELVRFHRFGTADHVLDLAMARRHMGDDDGHPRSVRARASKLGHCDSNVFVERTRLPRAPG